MKKNVLCVLLLLPILTSCQSLRTRLNPFNGIPITGQNIDVREKNKVVRIWSSKIGMGGYEVFNVHLGGLFYSKITDWYCHDSIECLNIDKIAKKAACHLKQE